MQTFFFFVAGSTAFPLMEITFTAFMPCHATSFWGAFWFAPDLQILHTCSCHGHPDWRHSAMSGGKKKNTFKRVLMWMFAVRSWPFHSIRDLHFDKSALHTSISHIASNLQHGRFSSSLWLMKFIQKGIASNWKRGTKWKRATHCALSSMRWWKHVGRLQPSTLKKNILVYI